MSDNKGVASKILLRNIESLHKNCVWLIKEKVVDEKKGHKTRNIDRGPPYM